MREILFRGKRKNNDEWVKGFYARSGDKTLILLDNDFCVGFVKMKEVIPETVGQYTGLTDKNGTKVFEGDILRIRQLSNGIGDYYYPPLPYPVNVVVKWDFCAWMWETLCDDKRYLSFPEAWCHYDCEVIGNIHDNPELLKAREKE